MIVKPSCQRSACVDHATAPRALIERDELAVELADEHLAVAEREPAARPAAADHVDRVVELRFVGPEDCAGVDVDGEHVVRARDHVDHAVIDERLSLA